MIHVKEFKALSEIELILLETEQENHNWIYFLYINFFCHQYLLIRNIQGKFELDAIVLGR